MQEFLLPHDYETNFTRFTHVTDLFIAGHFVAMALLHFSQKTSTSSNFKIKVIADISCDIGYPIPSTLRASTIAEPIWLP